jgi:hypothetical protein
MRILAIISALECLRVVAILSAQRAPAPHITSSALLRVESHTHPTPLQTKPKRRTRVLEGAVLGFVVGVTLTVVVTRSGGSTAPCNRSANQDALSSTECLALAAGGGLAGAGLGAFIGSRIRVSAIQVVPPSRFRADGARWTHVLAAVPIGAPSNKRMEPPGAIVFMEAERSCPGGHEFTFNSGVRSGRVARGSCAIR